MARPPPPVADAERDIALPHHADPKAKAATAEVVAALLAPVPSGEGASAVSADVRAEGGVRAVEVQLGHFCNNRCVFCASGQLTERGLAQPVEAARVEAVLIAAAASGVRRLTFLGGEPTVQASFLPSLAVAQRLGFESITIFTNGARFADRAWLEAALAMGRFTWRVSVQGGDAESHDAAVANRGAYAKIVNGLRQLQAAGQRVEVNVCLSAGAVSTLPLLADLVLDTGVAQLCVDMVRPVSAGERSARWMRAILPRFRDVAPAARALLDRIEARQSDFDVAITHLPFCFLPERADRISHGGEPTVTFTADPLDGQGAQDKYAFQASDRTHVAACEACLFRPRCTGVPWQYLSLYGEEELVAVDAASLEARDPEGRAVADGLRDRLDALDVAPWRVEAAADARARRVGLRLRLEASGAAPALEVEAFVVSAKDGAPPGFVLVGRSQRLLLAIALLPPRSAGGMGTPAAGMAPVEALPALCADLCTGLGLDAVALSPNAPAWRRYLEGRQAIEGLRLPAANERLPGGGLRLRPAFDPAHSALLLPSVDAASGVAVEVDRAALSELAERDPQRLRAWQDFSRAIGRALRAAGIRS